MGLMALSRFRLDDESVLWALKHVILKKSRVVLRNIRKNGVQKSILLKILSKITELKSGKIEGHFL
jgi:ABC-type polysaccharide/polyol phosphate transport system ATPase subunit